MPLPRIVVTPAHARIDPGELQYDPDRLYVFFGGEPPQFSIRAENLVEDTYLHRVRVSNAWGETMAEYEGPRRFVSRKDGRRWALEAPLQIAQPGYMLMEILLYRGEVQVAGDPMTLGPLPAH